MTAQLNVIPIQSPGDPRISDYRDLKDRDLIGERGVFMAEGELVIRRLIEQSPLATKSLLLNPLRLASLTPTLDALDPAIPIYTADQEVFDTIAGFHIHRGALACGEPPAPRSIESLLEGLSAVATVALLEDLANNDNVGGVFRSASAFGLSGVALTDRCADPLYRKSIRVSVGAALTMPFVRVASAAEAIDALRTAGFATLALTPASDAIEIGQWVQRRPLPERIALVLGAEGPGLKMKTTRAADCRIRLGRMVGADSLNVAVAGAVAMHALQNVRGDVEASGQ